MASIPETTLFTPLQFVTTSQSEEIKGVSYPLTKDGEGGFFTRQTDTKLIQNNLRQLILTEKGERPMQPNFGVRLRSRLFEPLTQSLISGLKKEIKATIKQYEQRIRITDLRVWEDKDSSAHSYNRIRIAVTYSLIELPFHKQTLEIIV